VIVHLDCGERGHIIKVLNIEKNLRTPENN
jgi:hypothetical protein